MPWLPRIVLREQVRTANPSRWRVKTASRATEDAPLGFVTRAAAGPVRQGARTGLRRIGFFHQGNSDACRCRLVGEVLSLPSM